MKKSRCTRNVDISGSLRCVESVRVVNHGKVWVRKKGSLTHCAWYTLCLQEPKDLRLPDSTSDREDSNGKLAFGFQRIHAEAACWYTTGASAQNVKESYRVITTVRSTR